MTCQLYLISPQFDDAAVFAETLKHAVGEGGVPVFQLRLKEAPEDAVKQAVDTLLPICEAHDITFVLNDYAHLALSLGVGCVHLGDEDISIKDARKLLGDDIVIGASCYGSMDRAMQCAEDGADYVAFGQFYETRTKPAKGHPTPEILGLWSEMATVPCAAIGGITPDNCAPLIRAGADFLAVVSGVWQHPSGPQQAVQKYNNAIRQAL